MAGLHKYLAPTGREIVAAYERTPCDVGIVGINEDGTPEYDGNGSKMHWDDQEPVMLYGSRVYVDVNGELWTFAQLKKGEPV